MSQQIKLAEATDFVLDGTHGSPKRCDRGIPVLSAQNVKGGKLDWSTDRFTDESEYIAFNRRVPLRKGDVLLTIVGTVGRAAVLEEVHPLVFQRSVAVIRPDTQVLDSRFLFHAFQSSNFQRQLARSTNQSSQAGVYLGKIKELRIPLPPLEEQRRIAAILDQAEELRAKRRAAIALLDQLPQAIFLEMFGDPTTNPMGWPSYSLRTMATLLNGDRSAKYPSGDDIVTAGIPFISTKNIVNHNYSEAKLVFITPEKFSELGQGKLMTDDLMITLRGTLAQCAVFESRFNTGFINAQLMIIRTGPGLEPRFLHALITSRSVQSKLFQLGHGGAVPQLTGKQIGDFNLCLPPLALQKQFASRVEAISRTKAAHQSKLAKLDCLVSALQAISFGWEVAV
jgi:type I restriction enzyme, S subunit